MGKRYDEAAPIKNGTPGTLIELRLRRPRVFRPGRKQALLFGAGEEWSPACSLLREGILVAISPLHYATIPRVDPVHFALARPDRERPAAAHGDAPDMMPAVLSLAGTMASTRSPVANPATIFCRILYPRGKPMSVHRVRQ